MIDDDDDDDDDDDNFFGCMFVLDVVAGRLIGVVFCVLMIVEEAMMGIRLVNNTLLVVVDTSLPPPLVGEMGGVDNREIKSCFKPDTGNPRCRNSSFNWTTVLPWYTFACSLLFIIECNTNRGY